nr:MAG TPA: hypothetical protein [Caudoviricetes sp.]
MLKALVSLQMLFGYSLFLEKTKEKQYGPRKKHPSRHNAL